jgi:hypothetical protein
LEEAVEVGHPPTAAGGGAREGAVGWAVGFVEVGAAASALDVVRGGDAASEHDQTDGREGVLHWY